MKPILRGHFHQAMFFILFGAAIPLILKLKTVEQVVSVVVYIVCALTLFCVSTLYHRVNWSQQKRLLWKKLDHSSIYLMIAGTFTPVAVLGLSKGLATILLITIWSIAAVGIVQSIFFVNLPKMVSAIIYIIAGYLVLPYISELWHSIGTANCVLMFIGGLAYSVGAICYGLKWPKLNPKFFGYHEVFHLFVNLGAALHFFVIYSIVG